MMNQKILIFHLKIYFLYNKHFCGKKTQLEPLQTVIHAIHRNSTANQNTKSNSGFLGFCIDTGAAKSVIGSSQISAYHSLTKYVGKIIASTTTYKFGSSLTKIIGTTTIRLPLPYGQFLQFRVDIVNNDVPLLLRLEVIREHSLVLYFEHNIIRSNKYKWTMPKSYKNGHAFFSSITFTVLFIRAEIARLHLHFFHPSKNKLSVSYSARTLRKLQVK